MEWLLWVRRYSGYSGYGVEGFALGNGYNIVELLGYPVSG